MHRRPRVTLDHCTQPRGERALTNVADVLDDLDALADALPFLVARDDDRPPLWLSPTFAAQVAAVRTNLAPVTDRALLATRLRDLPADPGVEPGRFEAAARRLAGDAASVAFAIRHLEIRSGTRLPSWPELLRRRAVAVRDSVLDRGLDAALWFG